MIIHISALDLPELRPYRTLRRHQQHKDDGIFVTEGEKVVRRLLASDLRIVSILVTPEWLAALFPPGSEPTCTVYVAEKPLLDTIAGFRLHQGIMAVGKLPEERPLDDVLASLRTPLLIVALDGLMNAENVGVVVRNCAAFGVQVILVGQTSCSPYLRRAVRNSVGAAFKIPIVHVNDLADALSRVKQRTKARIVATSLHQSISIHQAKFTDDLCLVLGNEETGVASDVLAVCDERVAIPMLNDTDSLNVASASAAFLYEVQRQRSQT
ncbi:MAG: TrmH family RNA methyltransferase [Bacteroidota bacterium]